MFRLLYVSAGLLFLTTVGCGGSGFPDPVPVSGKVTYKGKPVEGAQVTFLSQSEGARSASGRTDANGNFSLTTFNTNDGAIPGEYVVTISKIETTTGGETTDVEAGQFGADYAAGMEAAAKGISSTEMGKSELPRKYAKAAESGLQRSVAEGQRNEFSFDLD